MWRLLNKLFGWDFVIVRFCHSWKVRKVTWFHNDAFCRPCMDLVLINTKNHTEENSEWKPLTLRMFKYREHLKSNKNDHQNI